MGGVMSGPDFLVIGAMKSGSTTLHQDLATHPQINLAEKESAGLQKFDTRRRADRTRYLRQWSQAASDQVRGEVSTTYTMAPHIPGIPERAAAVAPDARLIYILREPLARIVSHHHHDVSSGLVRSTIDTAVRDDPRFLDYSRYGSQLDAWREFFRDDAIRVLRFEDYVSDRRRATADLFAWLGLPPLPDLIDVDAVHNASEGKHSARGATRRIVQSRIYRERVRRVFPQTLRSRVASAILPAAPPRPAPPSEATVRWLIDQLGPEVAAVEAFTGGKVAWDLEQVLETACQRAAGGYA